MSVINIARDAIWTELKDASDLSWSADVALGSSFQMSSDGVVYDVTAFAKTKNIVSVTVGYRSIGVLMKQPSVDTQPFRIKACTNAGATICGIGIGYAPASPTGSNDVITPFVYIPSDGQFDEVVMVPALPKGDALEDRAIAVAVLMNFASAGADTYAHLSVQRLGVKPPMFAKAIS